MKNIINANLFAVALSAVVTACCLFEYEGFTFVSPYYFASVACLFVFSNAVGLMIETNKA